MCLCGWVWVGMLIIKTEIIVFSVRYFCGWDWVGIVMPVMGIIESNVMVWYFLGLELIMFVVCQR